jgi:hypothetical protein
MSAHKHCLAIIQKVGKEESQKDLGIRGPYNINVSCKGKGDNSNYCTKLKHSEITRCLDDFPSTRCVKELPSANGIFADVIHVYDNDDDDDNNNNNNNNDNDNDTVATITSATRTMPKNVQSIIKM